MSGNWGGFEDVLGKLIEESVRTHQLDSLLPRMRVAVQCCYRATRQDVCARR